MSTPALVVGGGAHPPHARAVSCGPARGAPLETRRYPGLSRRERLDRGLRRDRRSGSGTCHCICGARLRDTRAPRWASTRGSPSRRSCTFTSCNCFPRGRLSNKNTNGLIRAYIPPRHRDYGPPVSPGRDRRRAQSPSTPNPRIPHAQSRGRGASRHRASFFHTLTPPPLVQSLLDQRGRDNTDPVQGL